MTLYDFLPSGNGYKVRLLLARLAIPFTLVEKDIMRGETRTADFLALNPNGRIPVLVLDDGRRLAESDAILFYLAEGTAFLPAERFARAEVLQWMFFEQYSHEPYIAVARRISHLEGRPVPADLMERGRQALGVMERHLAGRRFFVEDRYTIADVALYAYTQVAGEGGFDLASYPQVGAWLQRVAREPGHVPITHRTVGA
jgi:glutathione S-transferase